MAPGVRRSEPAGARMVPPREGNEARGDGRRGIGAPHTTGEAGESCPRNPVEGRGRREMDPLAGKTANTPRLEPVSTLRQRIAERARHALGMAWVIFIASWTNGYATARSEAICRGAGCGRTRTSGSVGGQGQQRPWSTRPQVEAPHGERVEEPRADRLSNRAGASRFRVRRERVLGAVEGRPLSAFQSVRVVLEAGRARSTGRSALSWIPERRGHGAGRRAVPVRGRLGTCVEGPRSGRRGRFLLGEATGGKRHAFQAVDPYNRTAVPTERLAMVGRAELEELQPRRVFRQQYLVESLRA